MTNKKANILQDNLLFFILLVIFVALMTAVIALQTNGAFNWSDYYAKEIAKQINLASPSDEITIDVQKATQIAYQNKILSFSELFTFNNADKEVCVKLSPDRKTCYSYFNNVDVTSDIELGTPTNVLKLKIMPSQK